MAFSMRQTAPVLIALALIAVAGCQSAGPTSAVVAPGGPNTALARQLNDNAYALIQKARHADAEPFLHKAIEADVTFGPARNNLGLVYFEQGKLYPAAWEFQNAIRLMPYQPEPRNNLGLVFEAAGKTGEAIESYEKARKMEPDNPEFLANLVRAKMKRNDRDEEMRHLLEEVAYKDPRPELRSQAQLDLLRLFPAKRLETIPPPTLPK
jgi:Flp pilus assembly protein TadD